MTMFQTALALTRAPVGPALAVTAFLIFIPLYLGWKLVGIGYAMDRGPVTGRRLKLLLFGLAGLLFWCGMVAGPVLVMLAALTAPRGPG